MPISDTPPHVQAMYDALWQRLTPQERFARGWQLIRLSRECVMAGLRARFPHATAQELRRKLCWQLYGVAL